MASLQRRRRASGNEYWTLRWRDGDRECRRTIGPVAEVTEAQARAALTELRLRLDGDRRRVPEQRPPTLQAWSLTYLAWHEREYPSSHDRVRQIIEQWLVPVFGHQRLDELKRAGLEEYKATRDAAPRTIAKELRTAQALMNAAVAWEVIDRNPWKGVKPPQDLDDSPPRYLTAGELARLYEAAPARADWWRLMANTGLRRAEVLQARWDDWDGVVLRILSTSGARTKAGRSRAVPANAAARAALEAIKAGRSGGAWILPRMHPRSLSRLFEQDAGRAGVVATIHDLRHTFCTQLVLAGVHLRKVQLLAGHSTIRVTERYAKLLGSDLAADVERLRI